MKASELNLSKDNYYLSCNDAPYQYRFYFDLSRCFPVKASQAIYIVRKCYFSNWILNRKDVERVESLMNKHGFFGDYRLTKSKTSARLNNVSDFNKALKLEFNL